MKAWERPRAAQARGRSLRGFFFGRRRFRNRDEREPGRLNRSQVHQQHRVIVRCNPVRILLPTTEAEVKDHLFAVPAGQKPDGLHHGVTVAPAVTGMAVVDMPRVEAVRAVVSVASSGDRRTDELPAMTTLEGLVRLPAGWSAEAGPFAALATPEGPILLLASVALGKIKIVSAREVVERLPTCIVEVVMQW